MSKEKQEKLDAALAEDNLDWKDIVIFALDDRLEDMLNEMQLLGELKELSGDETLEMAAMIEHRVRNAIGKPLRTF